MSAEAVSVVISSSSGITGEVRYFSAMSDFLRWLEERTASTPVIILEVRQTNGFEVKAEIYDAYRE